MERNLSVVEGRLRGNTVAIWKVGNKRQNSINPRGWLKDGMTKENSITHEPNILAKPHEHQRYRSVHSLAHLHTHCSSS